MKCNILVVSPIHIGSGDKYEASEYVRGQKESDYIFRRINIPKYFSFLHENDIEKENEFINNLANGYSLNEMNLNFNKNFVRYDAIDKFKAKKYPKVKISEFIKTFDKAYIPGSSIKGAIKTAILYSLIDFDDVVQINNFINNINDFKQFNNDQEKFINRFLTSKIYELNGKKVLPPQKNILRFLNISDTNYAKNINIHEICSFMASERNGHKSNYEDEGKKMYIETINRGSKLSFNITNTFDEEFYSDLKFNNDLISLIDIKNIRKHIYCYSKYIIKNELEFCKDYDLKDLEKFYKRNKSHNKKKKPLLRIGFGSGFFSTTIGLKIKEYDNNIYSKIIENHDAYYFCFPKSRKITSDEKRPLGWVQLDFKEIE